MNLNNIKKKGVQGKLKFDNKYTMDPLSETIIENTPTHEEKAKCKIKISQLQNELKTVSLDWKLFRNMEECVCSTTFDAFNKKVNVYYNLRFRTRIIFPSSFFQHHCWSCGEVLCTRCMGAHTILAGHNSQRAVPTCKSCTQNSSIPSTSP